MLVTRKPLFRRHWHAVMPLSELAQGPRPFTLLGEAIVLFLDKQGQPAALADRCGYAWVALEVAVAPIPDVPEFGTPGWRTIFQLYETWATSPLQALENSLDNSHCSFVHRVTFGVAVQPQPSKYEIVETYRGFYAETVIAAANPERFRRISGVADPIIQRHMRNACYQPFLRRLDIEYPSGVQHVIFNYFTPTDDGHIQSCQWLFRNDTEIDCFAQMLIEFDAKITREDKDILESTDPDALVDLRRRGVEYSMDSDCPGILICRQLMGLLAANGEDEIHRHRGRSALP